MRTPILAVVALVFGLAAAYGTWHYISTSKPADPEHDVVVVKRDLKEDIQPNVELNQNMFEVIKMKQSQIGDPKENGYVIQGVANRDMVALTSNKRRSKVKLPRGKPILYDLQTAEAGAFGIQSQLAKGEIAYVVQTNQYRGGSGLLRPGMKVDVVVSFKDPNTGDAKVAVMFENIDVLAVNLFEGATPENQPVIPDRAVLRLKYDEMLRLQYFETSCSATVSLNMRSSFTEEVVAGRGFDPKGDRLISPPKQVQPSNGSVPAPGGGNSGGSAAITPEPTQPTPPGTKVVDMGLSIYDGQSVRYFPNPVTVEVAPSDRQPPKPMVPKSPSIDGKKPSEPDKKDDTKKDEPKKDDVKGGEAPKGGANK